jgi:hypothetical protein
MLSPTFVPKTGTKVKVELSLAVRVCYCQGDKRVFLGDMPFLSRFGDIYPMSPEAPEDNVFSRPFKGCAPPYLVRGWQSAQRRRREARQCRCLCRRLRCKPQLECIAPPVRFSEQILTNCGDAPVPSYKRNDGTLGRSWSLPARRERRLSHHRDPIPERTGPRESGSRANPDRDRAERQRGSLAQPRRFRLSAHGKDPYLCRGEERRRPGSVAAQRLSQVPQESHKR